MSEKLLPCPFCGSEARLCMPAYPLASDCGDAMVSCNICDADGPNTLIDMAVHDLADWPGVEAEAIAAWNRRTPAPEGEAWRAALRALVRDCLANDFNELWDSYTAAQAVLAASPVVPVGSGETLERQAATIERQAAEIERLREALDLASRRFYVFRDMTDHTSDRVCLATWADDARAALTGEAS
jgi:Lar family restriction alleviation protein